MASKLKKILGGLNSVQPSEWNTRWTVASSDIRDGKRTEQAVVSVGNQENIIQ